MTVVTWSSFGELSVSAKYQVCSTLPSGRFLVRVVVSYLLLVTCDEGKTKSTPSPTDLDWTVRLDWSLKKKLWVLVH